MNNLQFSIIIPTYNRAHLLKRTLDTVFSQSYSNYEVIVIDDGSTDNTIELLNSISDPRFKFISIQNSERSAARNRGVKIATGSYISFLDSDDLLLNNHLQTAFDEITTRGYPTALHLNFEVRDEGGRLIRKRKRFPETYVLRRKLIKGNPFSCNGMFLKRDIAIAHKFNEDRNLTSAEDYLLWIIIASRYPIYTCNKVTSILVNHPGRSVKGFSLQSLITRKKLLSYYAFSDKEVRRFLGSYRKAIESYSDTYSAIHLVSNGDLKNGFRYFLKGVLAYPWCIFDKRTLGIIKHILIGVVGFK